MLENVEALPVRTMGLCSAATTFCELLCMALGFHPAPGYKECSRFGNQCPWETSKLMDWVFVRHIETTFCGLI